MAKQSSDETDFHLTQSLNFNGKKWIKPSGTSSSGTQNSTQSFTPRYLHSFLSHIPFYNQQIYILFHITLPIISLIFLYLKTLKNLKNKLIMIIYLQDLSHVNFTYYYLELVYN